MKNEQLEFNFMREYPSNTLFNGKYTLKMGRHDYQPGDRAYTFNEWGERSTTPLEDVQYDPVETPKHYLSHPSGVECITITEHMSFNLGNVFKYCWRTDHKNGIQDLEKALWYLKREIALRKKNNNE